MLWWWKSVKIVETGIFLHKDLPTKSCKADYRLNQEHNVTLQIGGLTNGETYLTSMELVRRKADKTGHVWLCLWSQMQLVRNSVNQKVMQSGSMQTKHLHTEMYEEILGWMWWMRMLFVSWRSSLSYHDEMKDPSNSFEATPWRRLAQGILGREVVTWNPRRKEAYKEAQHHWTKLFAGNIKKPFC